VIESGSMTPALRVGGVAVLWPEPVSAVRAGQIIAFHPPGQANYVRIHRVIAVTNNDGRVFVRTKGDANNAPDPGLVQLVGKTAYAEHYFVPYVGYLGVWLYKQSTRVALEVILFALMVAGGLFLIWGNKGEQQQEETAEKELVIPRRWPRPEHGATELPRVASEKASAVSVVSAASTASTASTASLLALSHIYTAGSEGGRVAAGADEPVAKQQANTGG
jgi:signal peptidase I